MDIKEVKEEFKKEEELLVKVFKLEKFIKKYKKPLIAFLIVLVVGLIGYNGYNYYKLQEKIKANNLLEEVISNPNNKEALNELKKYKDLYNLYLLQKGNFNKINSTLLEDIKAYEIAIKKGDIKSLEEYLNNPNYTILKNGVRVALIRLYLEKGNRDKALVYANEIPQTSQFKQFAIFLIHYGIVK
ncbi:tetratricopeptide repeat protein [Caminibacter mediatlanticus]|uniref:Ancillary SecYEG translocon subunit/Cell division coordinator CpoB TPR domain-containing protein n=1 Tax=Caminibacter mediatlanticus TB-2 TaxID=391592 RepID=A0AAI9AHW9_9BACT|nr:tetratricopeptide repeat protein [Caminibacter mediatlanticus]EDM23937.1 hypothetical protein CMTB2_06776 [Caminibacter mediatlanticus TB-2]